MKMTIVYEKNGGNKVVGIFIQSADGKGEKYPLPLEKESFYLALIADPPVQR